TGGISRSTYVTTFSGMAAHPWGDGRRQELGDRTRAGVGRDASRGGLQFWGASMLLRLGTRSGGLPVFQLRSWLPGGVVVAAGLAGAAGWAKAQQPMPMPTPTPPGMVVPIPGSGTGTGTPTPALPPEKTVTVNFKIAEWGDVLEWFSKESGLTPIYSVKPTGSVTLQPPKDRKFTMGEVVDLLNEAMMQQKSPPTRRRVPSPTLPSDEKVDGSVIPRIEMNELPRRGKTELVQVLMPLQTLAVEDTMPEVQKMLTP